GAVASPSLALAQERAKGTEILWDRYGVPRIFAPDHASLFYTYGCAQMEAHSELLLRLYAQARGRGAEYYGATYLDVDRWVGFPTRRQLVHRVSRLDAAHQQSRRVGSLSPRAERRWLHPRPPGQAIRDARRDHQSARKRTARCAMARSIRAEVLRFL